ncbi:EAL domain-containing protein (putative c-di-GMP-specific phosphodiesterase class I) [Arthrobacter sp. SLBN-100]|uniref:EAL domain-containing protein n=1 Tax=Arthrobacter sp. SLBN-100 TaxID=2768450 RepID=UPI001150B4D2|nr:EAL domain-containing protein [Arthrobacter sp. SLBN-100]TQJ68946.1 EAL domain-containing protein (putative c-di-GMP-specific phosphodiesterase class I) [Arthrobacter sp. SLBN-100]
MSVRVQAWGIIAAVLADPDPSGAAVRQRLSKSLDENPGVPERALLEYLLETRRSDANTVETLDSARKMRLEPSALPPQVAEQLDAIRSTSRISALLESHMLMTAFQPIYGLAKETVVGVEALSRFVSDDGAAAELWFAEAAAVGLGANLEFSALGSAAAAARDLPGNLYVSLNISPTSCLDPRLPELFEHIDLPINRVVLELTESVSDEEYPQFIAAMNPLRDRGLRIAVDDTHSGAGALSRMVHLRPDFLKVGRNVIGDVDNDGIQRALAGCLVDFAEQIGTTLIAEGIETVGELKVLTELGISAGQGYLLGRPSVRPQDWASWNTTLDMDGLKRQLVSPEQGGHVTPPNDAH